jgi:threonine dehydratase
MSSSAGPRTWKVGTMRRLGARVELGGEDYDAAFETARGFAADAGLRLVQDGREVWVAAGAWTIRLEVTHASVGPDIALVPVGNSELRVIVVLGVGTAHPAPGRRVHLRGGRAAAAATVEGAAITLTVLRDEDYHRLMSELPRPVRTLTLAEIQADWTAVLDELKQGGAVLLESDGGEAFLGVLTRDAGMIGEAEIAQLVENGHIPPLEELLAMDDRGERP